MQWAPLETIPIDEPCLVYLEKELQGSRIHVKSNATTIAGRFSFDVPRVLKWAPLPEPPKHVE